MVTERELEIQEHMPVRFMAGPIKECGVVQKTNPIEERKGGGKNGY